MRLTINNYNNMIDDCYPGLGVGGGMIAKKKKIT